jgi:hypothetical protein
MNPSPRHLRFLLLTCACLSGCRGSQRLDTVLASVPNSNHTWRATILLRQDYVEGQFKRSPTTYVLLDKDTGAAHYENGVEFSDSQVVMKPSQCGQIKVEWIDDQALRVICDQCGLALSAIGRHADGIGAIRIEYEGFPEHSSWETASQPH